MRTHLPARDLPTLGDVLALGDETLGEIIDRELFLLGDRPNARGFASFRVVGDLGPPFVQGRGGGPGGWWLVPEPIVALPNGDVLRPALAGWTHAHRAAHPGEGPVTLAPDWVLEVTTPASAAHERGPKRKAWLRAGVKHLWVLDAERRCVEVFVPGPGGWGRVGLGAEGEVARLAPFAGQPIELARYFLPRT
jgi:hypothetical protein